MPKGDKPKGNDKLRFMFSMSDEKNALSVYNFMLDYNNKNYYHNKKQKNAVHQQEGKEGDETVFDIAEQLMIYLQKEEEIFVKYGDEEAEHYIAEEAAKEKKAEEARRAAKEKKQRMEKEDREYYAQEAA